MNQTKALQTISPTKKKSVDILSNLPELLRHKILDSLPLEDAVRTSILSKHWRYEWHKLSHIMFDEAFTLFLVAKLRHDFRTSSVFSNIVSDVLHRHVGPLRKFFLVIPSYLQDRSIIGEWLEIVLQKRVCELTLIDLPCHKKLPSIVFFYAGLTHLSLVYCKFTELPSAFTVFPNLISLALNSCDLISANHIERLISGCPQLKFLLLCSLNIKGDSNCLTIHAPKLEQLIVRGFYHTLCLGNSTTNIRTLELNFTTINQSTVVYRSLPVIQSLRLGTSFMKNKNHKSVGEQRMGAEFESLDIQVLHLEGVPPDCSYVHYSVLKLLNTYRHLQKLFYVSDSNFCNCGITPMFSFWDVPNTENGNVMSLKYAEFAYVTGLGLELEFIKVILECAPVLEVMTIKLDESIEEPDARLRIVRTVTQFYRASRSAQIIFKDSEYLINGVSLATSIIQDLCLD